MLGHQEGHQLHLDHPSITQQAKERRETGLSTRRGREAGRAAVWESPRHVSCDVCLVY
jgi:hypothetical protein